MIADRKQICLARAYKVRHWMHELRCTEGELYAAVRTVGEDLDAIRAFRATCPASVYAEGDAFRNL